MCEDCKWVEFAYKNQTCAFVKQCLKRVELVRRWDLGEWDVTSGSVGECQGRQQSERCGTSTDVQPGKGERTLSYCNMGGREGVRKRNST